MFAARVRTVPLLLVLAGAVLFALPALLNGFPFIFPDSIDYLVFTPRIYRSPYYGLFIFFFHLNHFIWAPVFAQALIAAGLLWLMVDLHIAQRKNAALAFLILFLAVFSSLPWFTGFIMADIFTPFMFLLMYIVGFHYEKFSRPMLLGLLLLACIATAAHITNLTMGALILPLFALLFWWEGLRGGEIVKRIGLLAAPVILTAAAVLLYNVAIFGVWSLSPAAQSFLMANLIQHGPARAYLEEACPQAGYKICPYVHRLPDDANVLLWWGSDIYEKLGGFVGMKDEARDIVVATVKRYPAEVARVTATNFLAALIAHEPGSEFNSRADVPTAAPLLELKFGPQASAAYRNSGEMRDALPHNILRAIDNIATPAFFLVLLAAGITAAARGQKQAAALAAIVICAVLGNTLLCAAVSGVHDRYQARMTWLLPLAAFFVLHALFTSKKRA